MSISRLNLIGFVLIILFAVLQYHLWFTSGGVFDVLKLKRMLAAQATENQKLKTRNDELIFQISRLQNSQDAVEARARNELGMIKKGEMFYQVIKENDDKKETQ